MLENAKAQARMYIQQCDANGDGVVEWSEVLKLISGTGMSEEEISQQKAEFETMDVNKDGRVTEQEFTEWMMNCFRRAEIE